MKKTKIKAKIKPEKVKDQKEEYPDRLSELESELRTYPSRTSSEVALTSVLEPKEVVVGHEKIIQFKFGDKTYAVGHADRTFADSHHARGVRHISFYVQDKVVYCIEGDFEDQQFGSNFKFHYVEIYEAGEWEKDFIELTDDLRMHKEKRRLAFRKKRATENSRKARSHSYP